MLQRDINVRTDLFVPRDRFQKLAGDFVGIRVEETHPPQVFNFCQTLQQQSKAIFQAQVFAIAGGVLADQRDFAHTIGSQPLRFSNYGFKMTRPELSAKLGNNAEATRMVTALSDLDVSRRFGVASTRGVVSS